MALSGLDSLGGPIGPHIAGGVGTGTGAGKLALIHDQVFGANGLTGEVAFQDLAHACRIACLGRERSAGDVGGHAVMGP